MDNITSSLDIHFHYTSFREIAKYLLSGLSNKTTNERHSRIREFLRLIIRYITEFKKQSYTIAQIDNHIIGYAVIRPLPSKYHFPPSNSAFILGPYSVNIDYRGLGIGRSLIAHAEKSVALSYGSYSVYSYVGPNNKPSQKCFERCNYTQIGYLQKENALSYSISQEPIGSNAYFVYKKVIS